MKLYRGPVGPDGRSDAPASRRYAWAVFALTFALMMFDHIDRSMVTSILPLIKVEWSLSDSSIGALSSIVHLTIGVFALPVAVLADRWSRARCIFGMAFVWSSATIACAFATSYAQFFVLRGMVGAGEAGYNPLGAALLSSLFPARMRARILTLFAVGANLGGVLGAILGGIISKHYGWQATYGIIGVPGLVLALLYALVRDPKGSDSEIITATGSHAKLAIVDMMRALVSSPSALAVYVGGAFQLFVVASVLSWLPSFLNRTNGLATDKTGLWQAAVGIVGSVGAVLWGTLSDRTSRYEPSNKLRVMALSTSLSAVVLPITFGLVPPGKWQFSLILLSSLIMTGTVGTVNAVAFDVVHPSVRATAMAAGVLIQNFLGLSAGPFLAGAVSDKYGLGAALGMIPSLGLLASIVFLVTLRLFKRDLEAVSRRKTMCGDSSAQAII